MRVRRLLLLLALAAFLLAPTLGRETGRSATVTAANPTVCGRAFPPLPLTAAAAEQPRFDQPRGPRSFQPDAALFDQVLARTGATLRLAAFSTQFTHATPSQEANIALTARKLTGVVVRPGAVFSYNRTVGPFTEAGGYGWGRMFVGNRIVPTIGGGVCQAASTLYNVVLLANLPVVERHAHGLTVPYLPPGRDATVTDQGGLDFRFRNNTPGPLVLWGQAEDRVLTLALYGTQAPPAVRIHTEVLQRFPFATEVVADPQLPRGEERIAAPGQDGARSRTWIEVETADGWVRHDLHRDTYRPSPRVVLRGTGPPAK